MIHPNENPEKKVDFFSAFNVILTDLSASEKKEMEIFLAQTKEKIKQWQQQFEQGSLTLAEIQWLLYSEKEMLSLKTLEATGLSIQKLKEVKEVILDQYLNTFFNTN